jgi:hypothetical protein
MTPFLHCLKDRLEKSVNQTLCVSISVQVEKRTMLENLELILLTIDETVRCLVLYFVSLLINMRTQIDSGYIMELDATAVVGRVLMKGADRPEVSFTCRFHLRRATISFICFLFIFLSFLHFFQQPQTIGDLSISQALGLARDQFFRTLTTGSSK